MNSQKAEMKAPSAKVLPAVLCLCWAALTSGQDVELRPTENVDALRSRFGSEMAKFRFAKSGNSQPFALREDPIQYWTNATRGVQQGAVFVWLDRGQPAVIGTTFVVTRDGEIEREAFAFHTLAGAVNGDYQTHRFWTPQKEIEWVELADADPPAADARTRLRQMRRRVREFTAEITYPVSKAGQLRLMPQPIFRYSSTKHGIIDGAVFVFSAGTDPEVILLLQADERENRPAWHYAVARFHYWGLKVNRHGKPVWTAEAVMSMEGNYFGKERHRNDIYNSFRVNRYFPRESE